MILETEVSPRSDLPNIVLVDDDPMIVELIAGTISPLCRSLTIATGVGQAMQKLEECLDTHCTPDIVLMDIHLADGRGETVCTAMRDPNSRIYCPMAWIIAFTVDCTPEGVRSLLEAGANDYLAKPTSPKKLRVKMEVARFAHARTRALKTRLQLLEKEVVRLS